MDFSNFKNNRKQNETFGLQSKMHQNIIFDEQKISYSNDEYDFSLDEFFHEPDSFYNYQNITSRVGDIDLLYNNNYLNDFENKISTQSSHSPSLSQHNDNLNDKNFNNENSVINYCDKNNNDSANINKETKNNSNSDFNINGKLFEDSNMIIPTLEDLQNKKKKNNNKKIYEDSHIIIQSVQFEKEDDIKTIENRINNNTNKRIRSNDSNKIQLTIQNQKHQSLIPNTNNSSNKNSFKIKYKKNETHISQINKNTLMNQSNAEQINLSKSNSFIQQKGFCNQSIKDNSFLEKKEEKSKLLMPNFDNNTSSYPNSTNNFKNNTEYNQTNNHPIFTQENKYFSDFHCLGNNKSFENNFYGSRYINQPLHLSSNIKTQQMIYPRHFNQRMNHNPILNYPKSNESFQEQISIQNETYSRIEKTILSKAVYEPPLFISAMSNNELFINPCRLKFEPRSYWEENKKDFSFREIATSFFRIKKTNMTKFIYKLYNMLILTSKIPLFKGIVGVNWITDKIFSVDAECFAAMLGIEFSSINYILFGKNQNFLSLGFDEVKLCNYQKAGLCSFPEIHDSKIILMFHIDQQFIRREFSTHELDEIENYYEMKNHRKYNKLISKSNYPVIK